MSVLHKLGQKPVIAALRNPFDIMEALHSHVDIVFFRGGSFLDVVPVIETCKNAGKRAFLHIDLIKGLSSSDMEALAMIKQWTKADGIVTPKSFLIKEAKDLGLDAMLHLFLVDSLAIQNGMAMLSRVNPDAIEIMPGAIPKVIQQFAEGYPKIPIVASGLIESRDEVRISLEAGATAAAVSERSLWQVSFQQLFPTQRTVQSI